MSVLEQLTIQDLTPAINRLRRRHLHQVLPARSAEEWITLHYSGVVYANRQRPAELDRIVSEAQYQLGKNYAAKGKPPAYPDGLLYDFVVLTDGLIARTRTQRQQLWHCGNATGNRSSWSVHVMLGPNQDLLPAQRASLFALFDALRADGGIPRDHVVAHCEWPRVDGLPVRSTTYKPQRLQSVCPGQILHGHVVAYRAGQG